jgi:hypothetical protein
MNGEASILFRIPIHFLHPGTRFDYVSRVLKKIKVFAMDPCMREKGAHLGIGADLEPSVAEVALASKSKHGSGKIHSDLAFFSVVAHAHTNMVVAGEAAGDQYRKRRRASHRQVAHHQILKGNSKRVIKMPWSIFRALSPSACLPRKRVNIE